MANVSNENLILKIRGISNRVKQIQDEAGDIFVDHPAAKRLEYGFGDITIRPKNAEKLHFKGVNGEDVYADEVHIKATKPVGYVRAAMKETQEDLKKRFKEVMS